LTSAVLATAAAAVVAGADRIGGLDHDRVKPKNPCP